MQHFDLVALGGGSGGISAVEYAAELGKRCAIIEDRHLGGTCVNIGCVPKKLLWQAANMRRSIDFLGGFGLPQSSKSFSWEHFKEQRDQAISGIRNWYEGHLDSMSVQVFTGRGCFVDSKTIEINGKKITADHIVISTGSLPIVPNIPGKELGMISDDIFALQTQPKSMVIVGSGYIALEFACILQNLGTQVYLVVRGETVLRDQEPEIQKELLKNMEKMGIKVLLKSEVSCLENKTQGVSVTLKSGDSLLVDKLLWAVGRSPNTHQMGLENAGIDSQAGYILTDRYSNTNISGIYALGDVVDAPKLTPVAIQTARRLMMRLFNNKQDESIDLGCVPTVVFTQPPVATVGMTQKAAEKKWGKHAVLTSTSVFSPLINEVIGKNERSLFKLIYKKEDGCVVGLHMIGENVDEILQGFAVAIRAKLTKQDFDRTIAIHPSAAEEVVTLRPLY